jgi:rare lipoprotein A
MQWQKETDSPGKTRFKSKKYCWNSSNNLIRPVHGSKRFFNTAYLIRLGEKGDSRLKIVNRNRNKLLGISKAYLCVLIFSIVLECSSAPANKDSNWIGYTESGKASYYAMKFQSKKTASGELYDKAKKTAAHMKLPFGTKVKVTNTQNGKSIIVKINDRGPFAKNRIIDLSGSTFSSIANLDAGVIDVTIEVIK